MSAPRTRTQKWTDLLRFFGVLVTVHTAVLLNRKARREAAQDTEPTPPLFPKLPDMREALAPMAQNLQAILQRVQEDVAKATQAAATQKPED